MYSYKEYLSFRNKFKRKDILRFIWIQLYYLEKSYVIYLFRLYFLINDLVIEVGVYLRINGLEW